MKPLFSIAPMMEYTDRHFRYFIRLLSKHCILYTEMITSQSLLHGNQQKLLAYHASEHPIVIQLGGSDPIALSQCAKIAESYGYDEINLNVGCPSPRVQTGAFGACLMKDKNLVATCIAAMQAACSLPVTVKTRIGVDEYDSYEFLADFISTVATSSCQTFIIHARKAWLNGLSPKENREIPPLCYERVCRLKQDFPTLEFIINGGFTNLQQIAEILPYVDGVMIGRQAYHHPYLMAELEAQYYGSPLPDLENVIAGYLHYCQQETMLHRTSRSVLIKPALGLFHGQKGGRAWRRVLSEERHLPFEDLFAKAREAQSFL